MKNLPVPGRTFEATLGIPNPTARSRLLDGPVTEWHGNGRVKSHGRFTVTARGKSVPHGVWSYWYPSGNLRATGRFERGQPVGCFAEWEDGGNAITYLAVDGRLRPAACEVATDPEAERLAETYASGEAKGQSASEKAPPVVVLGLGSMLSPSRLEVDAPGIAPVAGGLSKSYWLSARHEWRWLSVALAHGQWWTDNDNTSSVLFSFLPGIRRPIVGGRVALEASGEVGARSYSVIAIAETDRAIADRLRLWTVFYGLRGGAQISLTPYLSLHAALFGTRDLTREKTVEQRFWYGPYSRRQEVDWRFGSTVYGALLELRIGIR